jgi:hypothetical protein
MKHHRQTKTLMMIIESELGLISCELFNVKNKAVEFIYKQEFSCSPVSKSAV